MTSPLIGILAGMGPRSTGPFLDLVVTECQLQYGARDDADFPKMMICSQPVPFYEDRPNDNAAIFAATRGAGAFPLPAVLTSFRRMRKLCRVLRKERI